MKKAKAVMYWLTIIPPLIDLIRGAVRGVQLGLEDIKRKAEVDMEERFDKANRNTDEK